MVMIPEAERTAIPLRAAPLVHPLANCDPIPKSNPPASAAISLRLLVILGECSTFNFNLP